MQYFIVAQQTNAFQVAAWQAAIVGALLGVIQLALGLWKQRRDTRIERAKFGYALLDRMFDDEWASDLLYALDRSFENTGRRKGKMGTLAEDFATRFGKNGVLPVDRTSEVYARVDALLYFCDRMEHAIESHLTDFDSVRTPTAYYVGLLGQFKAALVPYIGGVGYPRVLVFFDRFDKEWRDVASAAT